MIARYCIHVAYAAFGLGMPWFLAGCDSDGTAPPLAALEKSGDAHQHLVDFETFPIREIPAWRVNEATYAGPFSEVGEYYTGRDTVIPDSRRTTVALAPGDWLLAEVYTQRDNGILIDFLDVVPDPADPTNTVLKLSSFAHTDAIVLRNARPLPKRYTLSYRIGFMDYGGDGPDNGYDGDETSGPWDTAPATAHNGFYWLAMMDTVPQPHNNRWSHHHRKFFIDTWNNLRDERGINIAGVDGSSISDPRFGRAFIAYDGSNWGSGSNIGPVDYYLPNEWYSVRLQKTDTAYHFSIEGRFLNRGQGEISGVLDATRACVFNFDFGESKSGAGEHDTPAGRTGPVSTCSPGPGPVANGVLYRAWPPGPSYPDFFVIGDPHINYYEGSLLVDDLMLQVE